MLGDALEVLRIVAILASPGHARRPCAEIWRRIGLDGSPDDQRLPDAAAWGGYPGGLPVEKGAAALPAHARHRPDRRVDRRPLPPARRRPTRSADVASVGRGAGRRRRPAGRPSAPTLAPLAAPRSASPGAHDGVWATAGVHPHDAAAGHRRASPTLLDEPEVVAVGECGLDYHYDHSPRRRPAGGVRRPDRPGPRARPRPRDPHPRGVGRHLRHPRRRGRPRAHGVPLLHRRARRGPPVPSTSAPSCRSAASSRSRAPTTCGPPPPSARSTGCWSRPTRPFLAPVPHRGRPNRPPGCRWWARRWRRPRGVDVDEVAGGDVGRPPSALFGLPAASEVTALARREVGRPARPRTACARSRALGQNFVVDPNTVRRIARLAGVGPGRPGGRDRRRPRLAHPRPGRDRRGGDRGRDRPPPAARPARGGRAGGRHASSRATPCRLDWARRCSATDRGCSSPTCPTTWPPRWCRPARRRAGHRRACW